MKLHFYLKATPALLITIFISIFLSVSYFKLFTTNLISSSRDKSPIIGIIFVYGLISFKFFILRSNFYLFLATRIKSNIGANISAKAKPIP